MDLQNEASGINDFFNAISDYMNEFEKVVVYYDNGSVMANRII